MMADETPIGDRLGTERLYDEYSLPPVGRGNVFAFEQPAETASKPKPQGKRQRAAKRAKQPPAPVPNSPVQAKRADVNWRGIVSSCLELAGIAAITAGCAMIAPFIGVIVGGILLVVLGVATGFNVTN